MELFGKEFVDLLKHALRNFIGALVIIILAALFSEIEVVFERLQLPKYCEVGARVIAVALFIIDGIVVVGTALILALKLLGTAFILTCKQLRKAKQNEG